jgi:hypothetical protein
MVKILQLGIMVSEDQEEDVARDVSLILMDEVPESLIDESELSVDELLSEEPSEELPVPGVYKGS